jgi:hypothetical protein
LIAKSRSFAAKPGSLQTPQLLKQASSEPSRFEKLRGFGILGYQLFCCCDPIGARLKAAAAASSGGTCQQSPL